MPANRLRGEVEVTADGKTYILRIGTNELAEMEKALGVRNPFAAMQKNELGVGGLRTVFRVALSRYHKDLTEEQVGDIIDEIGGLLAVGEKIAESLKARLDNAPKAAAKIPGS